MSSPVQPWTRIYNDVKMHIPGLTDAVFQQMLYHVLNDFFDRTNIWLEEVPIAVGPNNLSYVFNVTKGTPNRLILLYDPALQHPDKKWVQTNVQMMIPGVIQLSYAPSSETTWNVVVAKTLGEPTDDNNYPDMNPADHWIISKYGDGVMYGVLGLLQRMPAKPYSNAKLGNDNWQVYVTERGKARTDALKANVFGGQRWMFPQTFATVRRGGWA